MNEKKFKTYMIAAKSVGGEYYTAYGRGLRKFYHGDKFGTDEDHEKWINHPKFSKDYKTGYQGKPPKGFHGNIGNLNASGDLTLDSNIQIRVNSQAKSRYVKQAQREGMKLSSWILKTLDNSIE